MPALAVVVFGLRALAPETAWARAERFIRLGFWGLNVGLGLTATLAVVLDPGTRNASRRPGTGQDLRA